ncbi:MAG: hypothetical protein J7K68_00455 [Candidatus Diapherotrites archaeon]|nr:hypothetical protein [Candidatus Diapherotrites archaeon]
MRTLFISLLLLSVALAACVNDGVCRAGEENTCPDCSFGIDTTSVIYTNNQCNNNGICELGEKGGHCPDCSLTGSKPVYECKDDGYCSVEERDLGNCADCQEPLLGTGLVVFTVGIGFLGFVVIGILVLVAIVFFAYKKMARGRVRL